MFIFINDDLIDAPIQLCSGVIKPLTGLGYFSVFGSGWAGY